MRSIAGLCVQRLSSISADLGRLAASDPEIGIRRMAASALAFTAHVDTDGPALGVLEQVIRRSGDSASPFWAACLTRARMDRRVRPDAEALRTELLGLVRRARVAALVALDRELVGRRLTRGQWRTIADALPNPTRGPRIARVLVSASCREDALKALHLVRRSREGSGSPRLYSAPFIEAGLAVDDGVQEPFWEVEPEPDREPEWINPKYRRDEGEPPPTLFEVYQTL